MKKKEYNKLIIICIILLFVISVWMFGKKGEYEKMGEQNINISSAPYCKRDIPEPTITFVSCDVANNIMTWKMTLTLPSSYIISYYKEIHSPGLINLYSYRIQKIKVSDNITLDANFQSVGRHYEGKYEKTFTTPIFYGTKIYGYYKNPLTDFISSEGRRECDGFSYLGNGVWRCEEDELMIQSYRVTYDDLFSTSSYAQPSWVGSPIELHSPLTIPKILNFQQIQIDLTHVKITFDTDVPSTPKYYLEVGGSWHLQNTGSSSTNHSYTFVVDAYTPTDYKIVVRADPNGKTTEKTGTIRTVGPEICGDGIDNDNDGLTDWDDTECVRVTITKKSENVGTTTYYGVFTITGDAEAYIEYQKGSGQVKKVNLTKVGQDYVLSLENLEPDSAYNGIIYAQDVNYPENNANIPLTFTTLKEGGIIEITSEETTSDTFNCKFRINADTINSLTFSYKTPYGSINEVDPNDQGNNTYAVSITGLSAGDYEYIIETSTNKGDDSHEGTFTIEEIPPETSPPPTNTNTPTLSVPPSPSNTDYSMTVLIIVVILLVGALIYTNYYKKMKRKRRR